MKCLLIIWPGILLSLGSQLVQAQQLEVDRRVPDEYETVGGRVLGLSNAGVASVSELAAVRLNPGMIALEKSYRVAGGFNWPTAGREFFHAGVVDSKSANVAAGFSYTGFVDDYEPSPYEPLKDSPLTRRAHLALAKNLKKVSVGVVGQYLEAIDPNEPEQSPDREKKGAAIGFGLAGLFTPFFRFGVSVENLANKKIADYAPRMVRAGVAYLALAGQLELNLDLRQRERVIYERVDENLPGLTDVEKDKLRKENREYERAEHMAIVSGSVKIYDMLRVMAGFGQSLDGPLRRSVSGGVAIVGDIYTLSFNASRPYLDYQQAQQAINASFVIQL